MTALLDLPDACDRPIAGATSVAAVAAGTLRAWMRVALTRLVEGIRLDTREKMGRQRSDPHGS